MSHSLITKKQGKKRKNRLLLFIILIMFSILSASFYYNTKGSNFSNVFVNADNGDETSSLNKAKYSRANRNGNFFTNSIFGRMFNRNYSINTTTNPLFQILSGIIDILNSQPEESSTPSTETVANNQTQSTSSGANSNSSSSQPQSSSSSSTSNQSNSSITAPTLTAANFSHTITENQTVTIDLKNHTQGNIFKFNLVSTDGLNKFLSTGGGTSLTPDTGLLTIHHPLILEPFAEVPKKVYSLNFYVEDKAGNRSTTAQLSLSVSNQPDEIKPNPGDILTPVSGKIYYEDQLDSLSIKINPELTNYKVELIKNGQIIDEWRNKSSIPLSGLTAGSYTIILKYTNKNNQSVDSVYITFKIEPRITQ